MEDLHREFLSLGQSNQICISSLVSHPYHKKTNEEAHGEEAIVHPG